MKRKIIFVAVIVTALSLMPGLHAFAEEELPGITDTEQNSTDAFDTVGTEDGGISGNTVFEELYLFTAEHLPEILTALSLAVSAVLAFFYKKGLIPMLRGALSGILGGISAMKEKAEESSESFSLISSALSARLEKAEQTVDSLSLSLDTAVKALDNLGEQKRETDMLVILFESQVKLIYELLESSNIPESKKEQIRARFNSTEEVLRRLRDEENPVAGIA